MRLAPLVLLAATACQTYQFEPVEPVTIVVGEQPIDLTPVLKPNLMLTVDRSGSMATPLDAACTGPTCATRMSELKDAVATFTRLSEDRVRLGLTTFPRDPPSAVTGAEALCLGANEVQVPLPPSARADDAAASQANRAAAAQVNAAVQALQPVGGTPTGATLAFLRTQPGLTANDFRHDFVVLLTDGLPNCNAENPNDFSQSPAVCRCQVSGGDCSQSEVRRRGCLDADATVAQVAALREAGVRTIVVGFGADATRGEAVLVLERLAVAGGVPRTCSADLECGAGDRCTDGACGRTAFLASNRAELEQVLATVLAGLTPPTCTRELPVRPLSAGAASLLVEGQPVAPGPATWALTADLRSIVLAPAFCEAHHGARLQVRVAGSP